MTFQLPCFGCGAMCTFELDPPDADGTQDSATVHHPRPLCDGAVAVLGRTLTFRVQVLDDHPTSQVLS